MTETINLTEKCLLWSQSKIEIELVSDIFFVQFDRSLQLEESPPTGHWKKYRFKAFEHWQVMNSL